MLMQFFNLHIPAQLNIEDEDVEEEDLSVLLDEHAEKAAEAEPNYARHERYRTFRQRVWVPLTQLAEPDPCTKDILFSKGSTPCG
jgi:hypothetical protein